MTNTTSKATTTSAATGGVLSMTLCVTMLIASEFMPVSLLTPIAEGLKASPGQVGQAVSISGFFAMAFALIVPTLAGRINRKIILLLMALSLLVSLVVIAIAPNFFTLMVARALLGISVGGFWALATSVIMRLVPDHTVPAALGIMFTGQAMAAAFAAPLGSFLGGIIGWRGVFWALVPIVAINLLWMWWTLPSLPSEDAMSFKTLGSLLHRRYFVRGLTSMALTFGGAFTMFTYLRPYLENHLGLDVNQISLTFLALGCAGFIGSSLASRLAKHHVLWVVKMVPTVMGLVTIGLMATSHSGLIAALLLAIWGVMNTALSVGWMGWMSQNVKDYAEAAGSIMVAVIQGAILLGSAFGGALLNAQGIFATFGGSVVLLLLALMVIGTGRKLLTSLNELA